MKRLFDKRLLAAGIVLAVAFVLSELVKADTVPFRELEIGDQYWEANSQVGYKLLSKVADNAASAFVQTCSGLQRNVRVGVKPEHRVAKAGRWEE